MLADQLLHDLSAFTDHSKDVFVYDYRGFNSLKGSAGAAGTPNSFRVVSAGQ